MTALPTLSLSKATEAQINAAVAEYCAGLKVLHNTNWSHPVVDIGPSLFADGGRLVEDAHDYLHDANAVIALLEKYPDVSIIREKNEGWQVAIMDITRSDESTTTGILAEDWNNTFCRAACIGLIRASGKVDITE